MEVASHWRRLAILTATWRRLVGVRRHRVLPYRQLEFGVPQVLQLLLELLVGARRAAFELNLAIFSEHVALHADRRDEARIRAGCELIGVWSAWLACLVQLDVSILAVIQEELVQIRLLLQLVLVNMLLFVAVQQLVRAV